MLFDQEAPTNDLAGFDRQQLAIDLTLDEQTADLLGANSFSSSVRFKVHR